MESPTNKPISSVITGATPPTAASAVGPMKRPATMESAELNSCCKMLLSANGMANRIILPGRGPCNMSMLFFFVLICVRSFENKKLRPFEVQRMNDS